MKRCLVFLAATVILMPGAAIAASSTSSETAAAAVTGVWVTPNGKSRVQIFRGDKGRFFGKIVWLKEPDFPQNFKNRALAGKPRTDRKNPDKRLRDRPIMGLVILTDFEYLPGQKAWGRGKCYSPEDGKTYDCRMWLTDGGAKLQLRGSEWIFHKTQTWTRFASPASADIYGRPKAAAWQGAAAVGRGR